MTSFNSYTQQICIDDAVVMDPDRSENVVTNDGTTMRIMAQKKDASESEPKAAESKSAVEDKEEDGDPEAQDEPDGETEDSPKESDSVDDLPDADEARTEVEDKAAESEVDDADATNGASESEDAEPASEPVKSEPKSSKARARAISSSEKEPRDATRTDRAAILANLQASDKKTTRAAAGKPSQPQGDDEEIDREAIIANLQANAERPKPKSSTKRSLSSDRAQKRAAERSTRPIDRAAIRAALTKTKSAGTPVKSAQEVAESAEREKEEKQLLAEDRAYRRKLDQEAREDERKRRGEEREEQEKIRSEKRAWDAKRREDARKAIDNAANLKAMSMADMEKIRQQNQFVERFNGMTEQSTKYDFDPTAPRGPSQTVIYTSRFVDRLSDVMDDMSISGSLSIKAGKIGGSGKGSFVDSDKFKESDLNFYISVKVINQTINFKDALVYNPLRSVDKDNFREVYGDSFVSGFLEGGEFNALVSMKILNKAKKTDIQAEAKVALTAGPVQIEAEANVGVARSNIETNTETTIQVSWSGGGHIKPMEQQWDIQSLMSAAARFPDLVADCPQRTYAILTKYDALRSFVARKPASYTALQYENAQIYTNTLLDTFVSYKALYKRLGEQAFQVQGKTMEIQQWSDSDKVATKEDNDQKEESALTKTGGKGAKDKTGFYPYKEETSRFEASITGLSDARKAVRRQMARIVNEVSLIEQDPKLATDEDHEEPFQSSTAFEERLPTVVVPERLRIKANPLSGRRIQAKALTEDEQQDAIAMDEKAAQDSPLFAPTDQLSTEEQRAMQALVDINPMIGGSFHVSSAAGDEFQGKLFNNLDYLKPDWEVRSIRAEIAEGALVYLAVSYENGLLSRNDSRVKKFGPFLPGERISSASIEHGRRLGEKYSQVLGLRLFTNRGRGLIARALHSEPGTAPADSGAKDAEPKKTIVRDGVPYEMVNVIYLDVPFNPGTVKGFFGRSDDSSQNAKIWRLGIVWCRTAQPADDTTEHFGDAGDMGDSEDLALLQKDQSTSTKSLQDTQNKLTDTQTKLEAAQKALDEARNNNTQKDKQIQQFNEERDRKHDLAIGPQSGIFSASHEGFKAGIDSSIKTSKPFLQAYSINPKMIYGLARMDFEHASRSASIAVEISDIKPSELTVRANSFQGCNAFDINCSWMTLPSDLHLEYGSVDTAGETGLKEKFRRRVTFTQKFTSQPKICVWLQAVDYPSSSEDGCGANTWTSIRAFVDDLTDDSFTMCLDTWDSRKFRNVRAGWFAYPAEEDGKRVRSNRERVVRAQKQLKHKAPFYAQPFLRTPATFIAISEIDFQRGKNFRFDCKSSAPNNRELEWEYGTWDDSDMDHCEIIWIAIE
ncbi:hypothetical protein N7481_000423 [Penicillium waksmanii]|uniref:uncharacterized protein n=1 Tax=Penicillium waksmanii TaxID=69791 RepID=UPI0025472643|nr:uncharacterized protein N7481_000423 [Penicillium waksmanii]KAJ6000014.1 hypothetical protein N7481_000423 [Penicillium waksmanii]